MWRVPVLIRKSLTPVSIMVVPHSKNGLVKIRIPVLALCASCVLAVVGICYVAHLAGEVRSYYTARAKFRAQMRQMKSTLASLQGTEDEVRGLLALKAAPPSPDPLTGTGEMIDMEALMKQVRQTIDAVAEIKEYLNRRHDAFFATPAGLPVSGPITSYFGPRSHPEAGMSAFHHGLDIKVAPGTPVRATADGIVSFSGWMRGSGNVVVVEHGFGCSTAYAHGARNLTHVGQRVKRGDVIAASGSTGFSTGPHVHYEVWKEGCQVDPLLPLLASLSPQASVSEPPARKTEVAHPAPHHSREVKYVRKETTGNGDDHR